MPVRMTIDTRGIQQAKAELGRMRIRAGRIAEGIAPALFRHISNGIKWYFRFERGPDGPWKPLAPYTIERKAALGLRPEILRETDRMMRSLTVRRYRGQVDTIRYARGNELAYGTRVPYASTHEYGDPYSHPPIPARPFMPRPRQLRSPIKALARAFILRQRQPRLLAYFSNYNYGEPL